MLKKSGFISAIERLNARGKQPGGDTQFGANSSLEVVLTYLTGLVPEGLYVTVSNLEFRNVSGN
jgi:hypothetical protein